MVRIQEHAASEIEAAGKAARLQLKRYAAQLAIDLAEQKIRSQITPEVQTALVTGLSQLKWHCIAMVRIAMNTLSSVLCLPVN